MSLRYALSLYFIFIFIFIFIYIFIYIFLRCEGGGGSQKDVLGGIGSTFSRLLEMAQARDPGAPQYCIIYSKNYICIQICTIVYNCVLFYIIVYSRIQL